MDPPVKYKPPQGILSRPLVLAIPILIALFFAYSPFNMTTEPPSGTKPWADGPISLVNTPQYETKKTDMFTIGASHMALLHNAILRGYNSIYQQAPHVKQGEKRDFVGYALTWHKFVKTHHDDEEATLFTKVEHLLEDKKIWEHTHQEHEAFLGGLAEFEKYLTSLETASDFSGTELRRIMSAFQEPFGSHFHAEIKTIAALADHPNAPKSGTPKESEAANAFKSWGKSTVMKAGTLDVVPFFLLNLDGTRENGLWANWPPIPPPIKWGLVNLGGSFHSGYWKFASCSGGKPKELYAVGATSE